MRPGVEGVGGGGGWGVGRERAFAGLDLLALVSLVALVGALGMSFVIGTRRKARLATCVDNLGKVNRAILAFTADHGGVLPAPVEGQGGELWWWYKEQVKGYAGLTGPSSPDDRVFACPDDRGYSDPRPFHQSARFDYGSYVFNGVTLPSMPNIAGRKVEDIREGARTLLVMEWTAHAPLSWHRSRTGRNNLPFYRDAENVVGFVDGHVRFLPIYYDGYTAAFTRDPVAGYAYKYSGD